jgi:hypothetical protein
VKREAYLDKKRTTLALSSLSIEKLNLRLHLLPVFGRKLVCDIEAQEVTVPPPADQSTLPWLS